MGDLILGTAQLGQRYGIANRTGQPDAATAHAIVAAAWEHGIRAFDTAPSYGASEQILGDALRAMDRASEARVVTKLDAVGNDVRDALTASYERLGVPAFEAVLVRRTHLPQWTAIVPKLRAVCDAGITRMIGVSVYEPAEALIALTLPEIRLLQLPANVWDHRFAEAGVFACAAARGVRVIIRSAFLQGLLFMDPVAIPERLAPARPPVAALAALAKSAQVSRAALALGVLRTEHPEADVIVGAETPTQVAELVAAWATPIAPDLVARAHATCHGMPAHLLDPSRWPATV